MREGGGGRKGRTEREETSEKVGGRGKRETSERQQLVHLKTLG